ncbi:hypothetical protein SprV_0100148000 [Sparganum proliferum]
MVTPSSSMLLDGRRNTVPCGVRPTVNTPPTNAKHREVAFARQAGCQQDGRVISPPGDPENWTDHLPLVFLSIRTALTSDLTCSAAELAFGATLQLPSEIVSATSRCAVESPTNLLHHLL